VNPDDLEFHAWPARRVGAQHGVLIIHRPTGIAAVSISERSQLSNKSRALALLRTLVTAESR
jgi:protein subunit release factor A